MRARPRLGGDDGACGAPPDPTPVRIVAAVLLVGVVPLVATGVLATGALATRATAAGALEVPVTTEVYRTVDGRDLRVDVRRPPDADGSRPALVLLHGGGWYSGDPTDMAPWAGLAADAGWVAFSLEYRLAAEGGGDPSWPAAFEDVQAGVTWVHDNAARFGADPDRVAVFGESAGGHLATLAALLGTGDGTTIRAAAAWSPPADLAPLSPVDGQVPGCVGNPACQAFWSLGVVDWFLGCPAATCPGAYADASPAGQVTDAAAPLWLANSTEELSPLPPVEQLADDLEQVGVDHHLAVIEGGAHAHGYAPQVWNDMTTWLADQLGVDRPRPVSFPGQAGDRAATKGVALLAGVVVLAVALAVARARHHDHEALA